MQYPIVIHKDQDSDYGVVVPDLPGCFSAGDTLDDALVQATDAILCHIEGLMIDKEAVPAPQTIEFHQHNPDYAEGVWALVAVDLSKLSDKCRRINITLPERVVNLMDRYASENGATRSGLIAEAALEYIACRK